MRRIFFAALFRQLAVVWPIQSMRWLLLHMVDAVGFVHAAILRVQALMLPVQTLVFSGH
jgi:hypothetical protein